MKLLKFDKKHKDKLIYLIQAYMPEYKYISFNNVIIGHKIHIKLYQKRLFGIKYNGGSLPWYVFIMDNLLQKMALAHITDSLQGEVQYEEFIEEAGKMILIGGVHPVNFLLKEHVLFKRKQIKKLKQNEG